MRPTGGIAVTLQGQSFEQHSSGQVIPAAGGNRCGRSRDELEDQIVHRGQAGRGQIVESIVVAGNSDLGRLHRAERRKANHEFVGDHIDLRPDPTVGQVVGLRQRCVPSSRCTLRRASLDTIPSIHFMMVRMIRASRTMWLSSPQLATPRGVDDRSDRLPLRLTPVATRREHAPRRRQRWHHAVCPLAGRSFGAIGGTRATAGGPDDRPTARRLDGRGPDRCRLLPARLRLCDRSAAAGGRAAALADVARARGAHLGATGEAERRVRGLADHHLQ